MTVTERAVLEILAKGGRPMGWYSVSIRLSMRWVHLEERLPDLLQRLEHEGLLRETEDATAKQRHYEITDAGRVAAIA